MDDAAKALRVSKSTLYKRVAAGTVPYVKLGAATRFEPQVLLKWLKQQRHQDPSCAVDDEE